jgi:RNA polymerase sigma factor (sigma-70 family)
MSGSSFESGWRKRSGVIGRPAVRGGGAEIELLVLMTSVDRDNDARASDIVELTALVRRVVAARLRDRDIVDDIVQETLARLLAARPRLDRGALGPYAIVTARNLVASHWRRLDTGTRNEHRLVDRPEAAGPDEDLLRGEEADAIKSALDRLSVHERDLLVAHEVDGQDTNSLAVDVGSTPGAVAAQLSRSRAKLRVEYLLELDGPPPTTLCRPVLLSLSAGDRRRQSDLDAGYHLLDCDFCATMSEPLFDRRMKGASNEARVVVQVDADIVRARQRGHAIALHAGFTSTEATVVATAISEIARNIVRFARRGEVFVSIVSEGELKGVMVVARDVGPGIADVGLALEEGYSTYGGRGLGLSGSRKLMDEFEITSEVGYGTTVTMTKWHRK